MKVIALVALACTLMSAVVDCRSPREPIRRVVKKVETALNDAGHYHGEALIQARKRYDNDLKARVARMKTVDDSKKLDEETLKKKAMMHAELEWYGNNHVMEGPTARFSPAIVAFGARRGWSPMTDWEDILKTAASESKNKKPFDKELDDKKRAMSYIADLAQQEQRNKHAAFGIEEGPVPNRISIAHEAAAVARQKFHSDQVAQGSRDAARSPARGVRSPSRSPTRGPTGTPTVFRRGRPTF